MEIDVWVTVVKSKTYKGTFASICTTRDPAFTTVLSPLHFTPCSFEHRL